ncbi:hypothetical protein IMPERIA89_450129 [Imperialibacter sp. 89]|nr:hypothetical protein IMPERIA89_450129 [Imperialibacter sp. 89]CAD5292960.1 hypothetical protein IMPERIA75_650128 [Imperialibacter sp. 75]
MILSLIFWNKRALQVKRKLAVLGIGQYGISAVWRTKRGLLPNRKSMHHSLVAIVLMV